MDLRMFQYRCHVWAYATVGEDAAVSQTERAVRFLEEAIELAQAAGVHGSVALQLLDDVYHREPGRPPQEVGGVMITLGAFCEAAGIRMDHEGETEYKRINTPEIIGKVRARQATKLHQF